LQLEIRADLGYFFPFLVRSVRSQIVPVTWAAYVLQTTDYIYRGVAVLRKTARRFREHRAELSDRQR